MRYLILILLNLPIILLAFVNLFTKYKIGQVPPRRFRSQLVLWSLMLIVLLASFPIYNLLAGNSVFSSNELSAFDIAQTTVIIGLIYMVFSQRQKGERIDRRLHDLHQELSIRQSEEHDKKD